MFAEVEERDAADNIVATTSTAAIVSSTWVKFSMTFTPNIATTRVNVRCRITNQDADAYFDHICLATANDVVG